jgi:osmotically-inducible protein OsmY
MKNNEDLQKNVQDAIKWEPLLNAAEIAVTVKEGIVTFTGIVDSYAKKMEAENAAKNIAGVKAVVEKLEIKFSNYGNNITDGEIATEILNAFKWNWQIPNNKIKVKVKNGWVTLEGELHWNYQREAATNAVKNLMGIKGICNKMKIKSETNDGIEKRQIESAIRRNGSINDDDIKVWVSGTKVTLTGTVTSWYQRDEAETIAWNAPGVWAVDNDLVVEHVHDFVD